MIAPLHRPAMSGDAGWTRRLSTGKPFSGPECRRNPGAPAAGRMDGYRHIYIKKYATAEPGSVRKDRMRELFLDIEGLRGV